MTVTEPVAPDVDQNGNSQQSLATTAARNLATTKKSVPQMQGITSRWLLRMLPWIEVSGGTYRVNRRLTYAVGDGRVTFVNTGSDVAVIPAELGELPILRGYDDLDVLTTLADRFEQREYAAGDVIVEFGHESNQAFLIAHGKVNKIGAGHYGNDTSLGTLADGDHFGAETLADPQSMWEYTVKAITPCTVLMLPQNAFDELLDQSETLRTQLERFRTGQLAPRNPHGEADIELASGHSGEPDLPATFVDYELAPREYELSVAQTVLRVHSRVADLYNEPMDQVEQQLRLTIEALRERQEHEMVNNPEFGLLANADLGHRIQTRSGPPTPDDMDDLLSVVWKQPSHFLAHPRTIAAFGRECSKRGVYPESVDVGGHRVPAWRGVPLFPCNKIAVSPTRTSSVMLMRVGEQQQGVVGLHQTGLPDEYQPGLSVRFMGISPKAIVSYLVSAYYSAAILVPDALGVLENVELGRED
ncbi:Crp/Fnr family transcriptional regulator [Actinophytocola xinjiangensis]|uniref:Crp/Fnr family transcriptional regulator n=1 Tax=Actinophytocola xinjiangensis TaxID=485602 RepID=A0A7Z0WRR6_9PSEU|nr:family 2B encapsulin nanocompartment shell protein [Actinophytocola xinjiangensis]OLF11548.1 Crp/Fnr family transcriptional regulator [Actinophytocola xinjiangensis]